MDKWFKNKKTYIDLLDKHLKREYGVEYPKLMILDNQKDVDFYFERDKNIPDVAKILVNKYEGKKQPAPRNVKKSYLEEIQKLETMMRKSSVDALEVVEEMMKELEKIKNSFLHIKKLYDLKFQHPTRPPDYLDLVKGNLKNIEPYEMRDLFEDGNAKDMADLIQRLIWSWEEVEGELKDGFEEYSRSQGPDEDDKEYDRWAGK
jgi:hypothetical protein